MAVIGGGPYSYFRYETHLAALNALPVYENLVEEFNSTFGRDYSVLETYRSEGADYAFVMMGCFATKAKEAVDRLRDAGISIGLVRPRLLRPFPDTHFRKALAGKKAVAVIDQNLSMGKGGVLHSELASVLYGADNAPPVLASFIGGLGGRDISAEEFYEIANILQQAAKDKQTPPPQLLYNEAELREVRKLQAIAHVERQELSKQP